MKLIIFLLILIPFVGKTQTITSIAGKGTSGYSGDGGPATAAEFNKPLWVKMDNSGNLFISDYGNHTIRKITTGGTISTFIGTGIGGFSGDGGPATAAKINYPAGVAFDKFGNVFLADWGNQRIRKVDKAGVITTVVGKGTTGYSGDGGPATNAELNLPTNITFDAVGNLYIADHTNCVVRKVDTFGIISTVAGTGTSGYSGDGGPATSAKFYFPFSVWIDASGNLLINDMGNALIRKVNSSGTVSTIAGNGVKGYTGDGVPATASALWSPTTLVTDKAGNIFIADVDNYRIRKVNTAGIITTVAGIGTTGFTGDGGPATGAQLGYPQGLTIDSCDNIYIADVSFRKIRKVVFDSSCSEHISTLKISDQSLTEITIYPNPAVEALTVRSSELIKQVSIITLLGKILYNQHFDSKTISIDVSNLPKDLYFMKINNCEIIKFLKI